MLRLLKYLWASPNTLFGVFIGLIGCLTGGKVQRERGCLEYYGGFVAWALRNLPLQGGVAAMTLGHTILGQDPEVLALARNHERVHVRQYELWGPFFLPAYLVCSVWLWVQGRDGYLENPFEVEAYDADRDGR
jgi:hypothetical protein